MATRWQPRATDMLREDHRRLRKLISQFDQQLSPKEKEDIVHAISMEVGVHNAIEEVVFYPAAEEALDDSSAIKESLREQTHVNLIIDRLMRLLADEDQAQYDARIEELRSAVELHIRKEERLLLPEVEKADLDLAALGDQMRKFKDTLAMPPLDSQQEVHPP